MTAPSLATRNAAAVANAKRFKEERRWWLIEVHHFYSFGMNYERIIDALGMKPDAFWSRLRTCAEDDRNPIAIAIRARLQEQARERSKEIAAQQLAKKRMERDGIY